jgi:cysteinyl-tRNA synthetase
LKSGNRIETKEDKEDPLDFALWKLNQPKKEIEEDEEQPVFINNEPAWKSPWGWGRPGWHIEDTAISEKFFGSQYEIHGGAEDLKFPHHESEIAQQEAASGKKPFVKIWMHTGFLTVDSKKMGKSLHNFITIRDFLKNHSPETLRFMVIFHHYRSRFDYTEKTVNKAREGLKNIKTFVHKAQFTAKKTNNQTKTNIKKEIQKTEESFHQSIQNDFNTPQALGILFKLIKKYQNKIWSLNSKDAKKLAQFITNTMKIFGFSIEKHQTPKKVKKLIKKRNELRSNKQFIKSDKLREKIQALGYEIEDTPLGSFTHKIKENNNG